MPKDAICKMPGSVALAGVDRPLRGSVCIAFCAALLVSCQETPPTQQGADLILENARVYTVNEAEPWAETVAIKDKRIVYVGSADGACSKPVLPKAWLYAYRGTVKDKFLNTSTQIFTRLSF